MTNINSQLEKAKQREAQYLNELFHLNLDLEKEKKKTKRYFWATILFSVLLVITILYHELSNFQIEFYLL